MQHFYQGELLELNSPHIIRNFLSNLDHGDYLLTRYEQEWHNTTNDYKWEPDQLAFTLEGFITNGAFGVFARVSG